VSPDVYNWFGVPLFWFSVFRANVMMIVTIVLAFPDNREGVPPSTRGGEGWESGHGNLIARIVCDGLFMSLILISK